MSYIRCSVLKRGVLLMGMLYLFFYFVPFDLSVVVAVGARAGDFPSCTHVEKLLVFLSAKAFVAVSVHHLQMEGWWLVATKEQRPEQLTGVHTQPVEFI